MWMGRFLEAPEVESWLPGELSRWLACWNSWLHTPNPNVQVWERGWEFNQSIANDYRCHYQWHLHRETSRKAKRTEFRGCLDEWTHGEVGRMTPLPTLLPCLPSGCYWIISFHNKLIISSGFPGGSSGKEPACQCRRHETQVQSLGREEPAPPTPRRRAWQPTSAVFLPGESHGQKSLVSYSP